MGWTLERYLKSTIYEWNEAVKGYWRNYERNLQWGIRELIWTEIMGNPYIDKKDKPKKKSDIYKLSFDVEKKEVQEKITEKDMKAYQELSFGMDKI